MCSSEGIKAYGRAAFNTRDKRLIHSVVRKARKTINPGVGPNVTQAPEQPGSVSANERSVRDQDRTRRRTNARLVRSGDTGASLSSPTLLG